MLIWLYRFLSGRFAAFWLTRHVMGRRRRGFEHPLRYSERWGIPSQLRPQGPLCWIHGASVGESLSVLPLVERLRQQFPDLSILVTTGTVTSAALLDKRLPNGVLHQFCPLDVGPWVDRFLNYWRPDCVLWVESEIWPNQLLTLKARAIPFALINGRLSGLSYRRWRFFHKTAANLFSLFDFSLVQARHLVDKFQTLGARHVRYLGNLKFGSPILPVDCDVLDGLKNQIAGRVVWVAASTHDPEEKIIVDTHLAVKHLYPNLLTIIIPRHPNRGDHVCDIYKDRIVIAQRSAGQTITDDVDVYVADTLGEVGVFYSLSPIVFLGGSFFGVGGHNPIEPALMGCAILSGPHYENFQEIYDLFQSCGAAVRCSDGAALQKHLIYLLGDHDACFAAGVAAKGLAHQEAAVLDRTVQHLWPFITKILKRHEASHGQST